MTSGTLATQLYGTFSKFADEAKSSNRGTSIIDVWHRVFPVSPMLLRSVSNVAEDLRRLTEQYREIETFDESFTVFSSGIAIFREILAPGNFGANFENFISRMDSNAFGQLISVRFSILHAYPEPSMQAKDIEDLVKDFQNLRGEIASSTLPSDIKELLSRQVAYIIACLQSVELMGVQAVYDALACGMMTIHRAPDQSADSVSEDKTQTKPGIIDSTKSVFSKALGLIDAADRAAKGYERVKHIWSVISPLIPGGSGADQPP